MQGKDGQTNLNIVKIGISEEGSRAPWLERIDENLLSMNAPSSKTTSDWKLFATDKKQRLLELLHRELLYTGTINEDMTYLATPLAIIGIEN